MRRAAARRPCEPSLEPRLERHQDRDDHEVVDERRQQRRRLDERRRRELQRRPSSSCKEMIAASDVSFSSVMNSLPIGGIAIRIACGTTTRRMMLRRDMPSARPASSWPGSTDMRPAG